MCLCLQMKEIVPQDQRDALLCAVATGMPSLRFVAYQPHTPSAADEGPDLSEEAKYMREMAESLASPDDCAGLCQYDLETYAVDLRGVWLWRRVVRGDEGAVSLEWMERGRGERLWKFLRRATVEEIDKMPGECLDEHVRGSCSRGSDCRWRVLV